MKSTDERAAAILDFMENACRLKDTHRSGRTPRGEPESVAAHSWAVCLLALLLEDDFPDVDFAGLARLLIIHDLGEAISGDIPATEQDGSDKSARERADLLTLAAPLPEDLRKRLLDIWDEYASGETETARLAKALDKIETMSSHVAGEQDVGFDYLWNLGYGRRWTDGDPRLLRIRREVDRRTRAAAERRPPP